ncbi:WbuC family cupin fold metalloprotein [Candidatus Woesearchaeota archaeon]|nr:WbuC family cupin fold metalloprotein [Candidatus Woesearchaeota archaeon]
MITIDSSLIHTIGKQSRAEARKRLTFNFHKSPQDHIQRFINVLQPESIVEPHRHEHSFEAFIALKGKVEIAVYDDDGAVKEKAVIGPDGDNRGVEVPAKEWHSLRALEKDSCVYIVMQGPYHPEGHKRFAPWLKTKGQ